MKSFRLSLFACAFGLFLIAPPYQHLLAGSFHPDHSLFTQVLKDHVRNEAVNYTAIKKDNRFQQYIAQLQKTDPATIAPEDTLAWWINAYNAFTIKVVVDHYPVKSIRDIGVDKTKKAAQEKTVWDLDLVEINGKRMSLNDIEHGIVRKAGDARIHFALVCAAKSCPPLRNEAYVPDKLNEQLNDQGRRFLADKSKNRIDLGSGKLYLSSIFEWFKEDFVHNNTSIPQFVARFVPKETARQLLAQEDELGILYNEYDWSLNE